MTEKKTPRPDADWTGARCAELGILGDMVNRLKAIDHGSNFMANLRACIDEAEKLSSWDFGGDKSFIQFLRDQAIKDRFGDSK